MQLSQLTIQHFDLVNNKNGCAFYKLLFNQKCPIDDFHEKIEQVSDDKKTFEKIISLMDNYSTTSLLPNTKFNHIKGIPRKDIFEFKNNDLRIYVKLQTPNVFIILGGYKTEQTKDIRHLKQLLKSVPSEISEIMLPL